MGNGAGLGPLVITWEVSEVYLEIGTLNLKSKSPSIKTLALGSYTIS